MANQIALDPTVAEGRTTAQLKTYVRPAIKHDLGALAIERKVTVRLLVETALTDLLVRERYGRAGTER